MTQTSDRRGRSVLPIREPVRSRWSSFSSSSASRSSSGSESILSIREFGFNFWRTSRWDPVAGDFGALPFIWGTLYSSILALHSLDPGRHRHRHLSLRAVPALAADAARLPDRAARRRFRRSSTVSGASSCSCRWCETLQLSLPEWMTSAAAVQRSAGRRQHAGRGPDPRDHDRALHLVGRPRGAEGRAAVRSGKRRTRWAPRDGRRRRSRCTTRASASSAPSCSGFGRALGETMAVTMVIGNNPQAQWSLFAPQYTMAAVIANEFKEAVEELHLARARRDRPGPVRHHARRQRRVAPAHLEHDARAQASSGRHGRRARGGVRGMTCRDRRRRIVSAVMTACALASVLLALVPVALILFFVISQGIGSLDLNFFTQMPKPVGETGGGMANAIVGTLMLVGLGALFAVPIGILSGIYVVESGGTRLATAARFAADTLNGVPSIVIGVFVYAIAVLPFKTFTALRGRPRARHHDDPDHRAHDRGTAAARADVAARRRAGARRDARPRGLHRGAAGGASRHHHRRRARARAHRGRDRAAALHVVQQSLLVDVPHAADRVAHRAGLHVRARALRRLAPPGLGRRARARHGS